MPRVVLEKAEFAVLGTLIAQLRFESHDTLLEQTYRAEHLITLVDPDKQYPYDFICYKLTDYKPKEVHGPALATGTDLIKDLVAFISLVTRQSPQPLSTLIGKAHPAADLARENGISTKTFNRWAKLGLAQRLAVGPDGIVRNYILETTWQWFVRQYEKLVARAAAFSRLTANQRQRIVLQARQLRQIDKLSRYQIEVTLAEKTGRVRETIRYILAAHDQHAAPEDRIFPVRKKVTPETVREMGEMFARGIPVDQLARIYGRSESSIYRLVNQTRQDRWRTAEIEPIYSHEFDLPFAEEKILNESRFSLELRPQTDHLQTLQPVQERALFRAYNYLKWKQDRLRKPLLDNPDTLLSVHVLDELDELHARANEIKGKLILANQALVISIAKRHLAGALTLDELVSEGLVPLMKAVEKFDYTRGFKFSTYASWAVMKHFARAVPQAGRQQHELMPDEDLDLILPGVGDVDEAEAYKRSLAVQGAMDHLDERERQILESRYGLDRTGDPMSLSQLGDQLGITKERVRQIESKAMDKLHNLLKDALATQEK